MKTDLLFTENWLKENRDCMHIGFCDDEAEVIAEYKEIIEKICLRENFEYTISTYRSGEQLLFDLEEIVPSMDILFLDVAMPGKNGLEVAKELRDKDYTGEIIFLTYSKNAVYYAFDVKANNYLLKEAVTEGRIEEVFLNAAELVKEKREEYILLTGVGEHRNIPIGDIRYFEVNKKIVTVYYGNQDFEFVSTIGKLENLLFNKGFIRISRPYLVSTKHIESFSYGEAVLKSREKLPVGRKYYKELKEKMKDGKK